MTSLSEAQYTELCSVCDQLLLTPDATLERVAIPWLHVLNEHPSNLAKYSRLAAPGKTVGLLRVRSAVSQAWRWVDERVREGSRGELPPEADVIFVSHLLNESQLGAKEDFYYGRLPELLREDGVSSCVVLINHASRVSRAAAGWSVDMAPRVLLEDTLSLGEELTLRRRLGREAERLRQAADECQDARRQTIIREAARHALSSSSLGSLRIYHQIFRLAGKLRPKAIVVTYEGHPWERLAFAAARKRDGATRCIGYHHTILFPRHHSVLRLLKKPLFDPDVVLTAGEISGTRFRESYGRAPVHVATMGTHRRQAIAASGEATRGSNDHPSRCLVIPDGIVAEVVFLLDFAIESARHASDIRFVVRLHPVVALDTLKRRFPRFQRLPANVEFSTLSLSADFSRSRWALYRGTNTAIYAVIAGLRPFYVEKPGEMSIDSLHQLGVWKKVVRAPSRFVEAARADLRNGSPVDAAEAAAAADYCKRYFMPADYRVFADALER